MKRNAVPKRRTTQAQCQRAAPAPPPAAAPWQAHGNGPQAAEAQRQVSEEIRQTTEQLRATAAQHRVAAAQRHRRAAQHCEALARQIATAEQRHHGEEEHRHTAELLRQPMDNVDGNLLCYRRSGLLLEISLNLSQFVAAQKCAQ